MNRRASHVACVAAIAGLSLARGLPARADASDADRREAAERFDHALRLVNDGDLSSGLAEFQRAYALMQAPVVAFNLGLVYAALHRPVEAATALKLALARPEALKPEDLDHAQRALGEANENIATVAVTANVREGAVEVDNIEVAKLPLGAPLPVSSGPHVIGVVSPGYAPARREVIVAGRETAAVSLELVAIEGRLAHIALACKVPSADVFVDGARVGKTPLLATITVAPGAHDVEVKRAGYTPARQRITLQDGSRADVSLTPVVNPGSLQREGGYLEVHLSETQSVLSVDGEEIGLIPTMLSLPFGPHRIKLERGGFLTAERDVDVPLGKTQAVQVAFEPNPETRVHYVTSAERWRRVSWAVIGIGAALAVGGSAFALVEQRQLHGAQSDLDAVLADQAPGSMRPCDSSTLVLSDSQFAACMIRLQGASDRASTLQTLRTVGWVGAGVGAAVAVTGVVLLINSDDPHRYDEKPSSHTFTFWQVLPVAGPGLFALSATGRF